MKYNPVKYNLPTVMVKDRLLEAAFFEFSKNGYIATNPDTITRHVGISRVMFYSYFKNKNEVLIHLIKELIEELSSLMDDKKAHKLWLNADTPDEFKQPLIYITEVLTNASGILKAFVQGMMQDKELLDLFNLICKRFADIFTQKINTLQNVGQFQGCDAYIISQMMAITLLMSTFSLSIGTIDCSPSVLAKNISYIFFSCLNFNEKSIKSSDSGEPKSEKSRNTRREILKAARKAIDKHGFANTTIENIAKNVGCSRGTIYLYYKKKDDILRAIEKDSYGIISDIQNSIHSGIDDGQLHKAGTDTRKGLGKKSRKTMASILSAAKQEFASQGYFDATIDTIAKKAGCSRSTLYLYYKRKDDIIKAIFQEMISIFKPPKNLSDEFLHELDTGSIDALIKINSQIIDVFENYSVVNWAMLQGTFYSRELGQNFKDMYHLFSIPLVFKIEELKKEGKCREVDAAVASRIMITCLSYSASMYNAGIIKCTKHELALNMAKFLFGFFNYGFGKK